MVTKDQKFHHIWGLILLLHCLNAGKVNIQQLQRCGNNDQSHWGFGMNAFMLDALLTAANCPLYLSGHAKPPEPVIQKAVSTVGLGGVQHHSDIHSWQLPSEPWGYQITKFLPVHQQGCGNGKGLSGRVLTSSTLRE